jgi:uncharacterized protein (TIGR03382 family)
MILAGVAGVCALLPTRALACGGFFCNTAQPVNQAAEGIIFADNGDGTTTAVIQIQYQGPSQDFSWLLPISSVPKSDADIGIASNIALQRLQAATNPSYSLNVQVEGTCADESSSGAGCGASADSSASAPRGTAGVPQDPAVTVEASGVVGAFAWSVISIDRTLGDPADAAVEWLKTNGYDVPSSAPQLLGPYLSQGLYLLALRLTKGADVGSIRPIVLTYKGSQPSIPVKLTAVAANDNMGVLTWVLGKSRAVPDNYLSLELNEARINWFNAASNYNAVVTEAANDAGGQGFVTEFAGSTSTLAGQIWTGSDIASWSSLQAATASAQFFERAFATYGTWDGFWDAARATVTLPAGASFDDLKACPSCYTVQVTPAALLAELDKSVIQPVKRVQALLDAHPQITRLYTTLSADEMTLDPLFTFNADLPEVNNVHTATRVIACDPSVSQFQAPWRIELPQGGVVWGSAADANSATWPAALNTLPPNRSITRAGATGSGRVIENNQAAIDTQLASYNRGQGTKSASGGCTATGQHRPNGALLAALALGAALIRRRQRSR